MLSGPHDLRLYTSTLGLFAVRASACDDPRLMVAFGMTGIEDKPECSAEESVREILGNSVAPDDAGVGVGLHPHGDPALEHDVDRIRLPFDVREKHDDAAERTPERVDFLVDDRVVKTVERAIDYLMTLVLSLCGFLEDGAAGEPRPYAKRFVVARVRGYPLVR